MSAIINGKFPTCWSPVFWGFEVGYPDYLSVLSIVIHLG